MSRQAQNIPQNYAEVREQLSDIDWHMQCMIRMAQEAGQGQERQPEQAPGLARIMKNISILQIKSFRQGWVSQGKTRQGRTGQDRTRPEAGTMPGSANPCQKSWTLPGRAPPSPPCSLLLLRTHLRAACFCSIPSIFQFAKTANWGVYVSWQLPKSGQGLCEGCRKSSHTIHILLVCNSLSAPRWRQA